MFFLNQVRSALTDDHILKNGCSENEKQNSALIGRTGTQAYILTLPPFKSSSYKRPNVSTPFLREREL